MKMTKTSLALIALGLVAAQGLFFQYRFYRERQQAVADSSALMSSKQALEQRVAELQRNNEALAAQVRENGLEPLAHTEKTPKDNDAARLETVRQLADLQSRYNTLQTSMTALMNRVGELEGTVERLTSQNTRLSSARAELREQLASTQRVVQAMEAELKSKADRVDQLEAAVRKSGDEASGADRRLSQITAVLREMEDINRRRENTVTSLGRRYRDVTEQLRALALRMDTQRDNPITFGVSDISRITGAVQSADDELRQLEGLNTQAKRTAEKLR